MGSPSGDNDCAMRFETERPPADAFWSVTMYDAEGFQAAPAGDQASNWLPAPRGPLGVTMRVYAP